VTGPARGPRLSPWGRLVVASAALVGGAALLLVGWGLASAHERRVSYQVRGSLEGLVLDAGAARVDILGGGRRRAVQVVRTDRYAFGHGVTTSRTVTGGIVRLRSRCPVMAIARTCSVAYRLLVPDNVPVTVRTGRGSVRFRDYRGSARVTTGSGDVDVESFCGFSLEVRSDAGDVNADTACPLQRLSLRTTSGAIRAVVPPARYRVDAESSAGSAVVRGVTAAPDAVFELQALSTSGDVTVEPRG
jgi:hypothetical protein